MLFVFGIWFVSMCRIVVVNLMELISCSRLMLCMVSWLGEIDIVLILFLLCVVCEWVVFGVGKL